MCIRLNGRYLILCLQADAGMVSDGYGDLSVQGLVLCEEVLDEDRVKVHEYQVWLKFELVEPLCLAAVDCFCAQLVKAGDEGVKLVDKTGKGGLEE